MLLITKYTCDLAKLIKGILEWSLSWKCLIRRQRLRFVINYLIAKLVISIMPTKSFMASYRVAEEKT